MKLVVRNKGFTWALVAVVLLSVLTLAGGSLLPFGLLANAISIAGGCAVLAGFLDIALWRGFSVGRTRTALEIAIVLVCSGTAMAALTS